MPDLRPDNTPLLDVPYLQISCLQEADLERAYRKTISTLNFMQTQAFWTIYHTQMNVLVSAPVGSGKSFLGEMAIWYAAPRTGIGEKLMTPLGMLSGKILMPRLSSSFLAFERSRKSQLASERSAHLRAGYACSL